MGSIDAPARAGLLRRLGSRLRAAVSTVVRDREPSRQSSYLIRGTGDGETTVVSGNSGGM
jgi:hypothetical protein